MLYVLLSLDGITNIVEDLVVDQQLEPVPLGESVDQAFAMLVSATRHVRGDAGVKHTMGFVCNRVDESGNTVIKQGIEGGCKRCTESCPCLSRAPTTFLPAPPQGVGGRDKPGHDSGVGPASGKA